MISWRVSSLLPPRRRRPRGRAITTVAGSDSGSVLRLEADVEEAVCPALGTAQAVAALSFGLAYSALDDRAAVDQLLRSASPPLLLEAKGLLPGLARRDPEVVGRARDLLESALAAPGGEAGDPDDGASGVDRPAAERRDPLPRRPLPRSLGSAYVLARRFA